MLIRFVAGPPLGNHYSGHDGERHLRLSVTESETEVSEEKGKQLLADFPSNFMAVNREEPIEKALDSPPLNKMVEAPPQKKESKAEEDEGEIAAEKAIKAMRGYSDLKRGRRK